MKAPADTLVCQGVCRQRRPASEFQYRDHLGRDRRRSLCLRCWKEREEERRREEREKDIERAKTDASPFGIARREVETMTISPEFPQGVPMNDWHLHDLAYLNHVHYEAMHRIWSTRETAKRQKLTRVRQAEMDRMREEADEEVDEEALREPEPQEILAVDGLLELDDVDGLDDFDDE